MQRRESLSAFSKEDTRRPPASSNRSNHPQHSQFDTNNANLTANINSPNNSKFPTPSGPANAPPFSIIQNNDPRVIYTGPWTLKGNKFVTTHSTTTRGASVHLKFNGTSIVVFGTVPASNDTVVPPTAVFVVDSNPPVETAAPTAEKPISNQPLFAADQLSGYYEHTINITIVKTDAPFTLESFFVTTDSSEASTTTSTGTATTTDTAISSADVSAHYTSPSSQKSARSSSGAHVGLKVAAAIIGTVLIIIIFSAVFFLIRRRREARRRSRGERESLPDIYSC
ncbi:hypothetical protein BDQ17DRAFT_1234758 [Cyathus striatus]|nr:hypothetical protein BDQ17DRAFT_1234758 [Cyathus striatus]